jgi:hypothetical protein
MSNTRYLSGDETQKSPAKAELAELDRLHKGAAQKLAQKEREFEMLMSMPSRQVKGRFGQQPYDYSTNPEDSELLLEMKDKVEPLLSKNPKPKANQEFISARFSHYDGGHTLANPDLMGTGEILCTETIDEYDEEHSEFLSWKAKLAKECGARTGTGVSWKIKKDGLKKREVLFSEKISKERVKELRHDLDKLVMQKLGKDMTLDELVVMDKEYKLVYREFMEKENIRGDQRNIRNKLFDECWNMCYMAASNFFWSKVIKDIPSLYDPKFFSGKVQSLRAYEKIRQEFDSRVSIEKNEYLINISSVKVK